MLERDAMQTLVTRKKRALPPSLRKAAGSALAQFIRA